MFVQVSLSYYAYWWLEKRPHLVVCKVQLGGIENTLAGSVTFFRMLFDGAVVSEAHVVHRENDYEQHLSFFGVGITNSTTCIFTIQWKVSDGESKFVDYSSTLERQYAGKN